MSTISTDERREVARRLRSIAREVDRGGFSETIKHVKMAVFEDLDRYRPNGTLDRLADLIEPAPERTCRVESSHEEESDGCYSYFEYELTCGHEIAWGDQLPPSYCPECGRRVLYDIDDYI